MLLQTDRQTDRQTDVDGQTDRNATAKLGSNAIDYLLKTRRIRLSNVSRLLKSARSGEEK